MLTKLKLESKALCTKRVVSLKINTHCNYFNIERKKIVVWNISVVSTQWRGNYFWTGEEKTENAKVMESLSNLDHVFVPELSVLWKKKVFAGFGPRSFLRSKCSLKEMVFADFRLRLFGSEYRSQRDAIRPGEPKYFQGVAAPLLPAPMSILYSYRIHIYFFWMYKKSSKIKAKLQSFPYRVINK